MVFLLFTPILKILRADGDLSVYFTEYYRIMLFTYPLMLIGTILGMFIRVDGKPQICMLVSIAGCILNGVLGCGCKLVIQRISQTSCLVSKIVAKAMWLLGEMGLLNPQAIAVYTANIAQFITSEIDLLRERAANTLGRIGRADYELVSPYMGSLLSLSDDKKL